MTGLIFSFIGIIVGYILSLFLKKDVYKNIYNSEKEEKQKLNEIILLKEKENATLKEKNFYLENQLNEQNKKFTLEFEILANKILEEKSKKFVEINEEKVGNILNPLKEKIRDFEKKVEETYEKETRDKVSLKEQIKNLIELNTKISEDANNLTKALKGDNKTQGDWGEKQLETLLERAGLEKNVHYTTQDSFKNDDSSRLRTDVILRLPDEKNIIIDSKISLKDYNNYFNEQDEEKRKIFLKGHLDSINKHITELSKKEYHKIYEINQPDYVFMFLPIEPAFWLAIKEDTNLIEKALDKNIVLVSVTNLLATLRIISMVWKQENQKNNVLEIAKEGGELYDKFVGFLEDMEKVGRNMDTSKNAYSEAMKKLYEGNGNIIKRTENLKKLGAKVSKQIDQKYINRLEN